MAGTDPLTNKADLRTIRTLEEKRGGWRGERKGNKAKANWEQSDALNG